MSEWKGKYRLSGFWYWAWSANPEVFIGISFLRTQRFSAVVLGFLIGAWVIQRRRKSNKKEVLSYTPPPSVLPKFY